MPEPEQFYIPPPPYPHTPLDILQHHYSRYDALTSTNQYQIFTYPFGSIGYFLLIAYLLIPHRNRPWLRTARFAVFAAAIAFAAWVMKYQRAKAMAPSLGVGLLEAWGCMWGAVCLVAWDAQDEFCRIENDGVETEVQEKEGNGTATNDPSEKIAERGLEKAMNGNGHIEESNGSVNLATVNELEREIQSTGTPNTNTLGKSNASSPHAKYAWHSYPLTAPLKARFSWTLDLLTSFRGVHWSFRPNAVPPPPSDFISSLEPHPPAYSTRIHSSQPIVHQTRRELLRTTLRDILFGYLILDLIKTLMLHDPYFWTGNTSLPGPTYLSAILTYLSSLPLIPGPVSSFLASQTLHAMILRTLRMFLSQAALHYGLHTIFALSPLFFAFILPSSRLPKTFSEPWQYPETWGPYAAVFNRGLAGWWAGWWHQTFRVAFEAPGVFFARLLSLPKKSMLTKLIQVLGAFSMSGVLHACASYTSAGALSGWAHPWSMSFMFFFVQGLAVIFETAVRGLWSHSTLGKKMAEWMPAWVGKTLTFVYVHVWFYFTGPLLCDDFAAAGVWLLEPIPVSLLRGTLGAMGMGVEGDPCGKGWLCWGDMLVRWHSDREGRRWRSGVAF